MYFSFAYLVDYQVFDYQIFNYQVFDFEDAQLKAIGR